ncbi:hypothetical protein D3OALGA1CA_534 [Olavius algarvensis associated proteobacterium Delta 3]|nr:hypothetical protein D3OALGA1CA_534 [Olavius algarvensis associated proteobacterium Delta 3]CAB5138703.1 hypothetical protein D3OALGB2SA_4095 [Olavius algarvensis associated proteobacterium Delta 3]
MAGHFYSPSPGRLAADWSKAEIPLIGAAGTGIVACRVNGVESLVASSAAVGG